MVAFNKLPEQIALPEHFADMSTLHLPKSMVVTGEASQAEVVAGVISLLQDVTYFRDDSYFHEGEFNLKFLAQDYKVKGAEDRVRNEHPRKLANGAGLSEGQATEAMLVCNRNRKVSRESIFWLGQAVGRSHIERVYFLNPLNQDSGAGLSEILASQGVIHIHNPLEVFRVINNADGSEISYPQYMKLIHNEAERR